jgi:HK97 gp10 family phage protein
MARRERTDVIGIRRMTARIDHIAEQMSEAAQQAADEELLALGVDISQGAPVDTGELRDSVHVDEEPGGGGIVRVDADHAAPVELGTARMTAQPYVQPALERAEQRYAARVAKDVKEVLPR